MFFGCKEVGELRRWNLSLLIVHFNGGMFLKDGTSVITKNVCGSFDIGWVGVDYDR